MPRLELSYYAENDEVRVFRAATSSVVVGSDSSCDVCLPGLAPAHAKIFASVEGFYVHELGGGVQVNHHPGSGFVKDGDVIQLAETAALRVHLREDERPGPVEVRRAPEAVSSRAGGRARSVPAAAQRPGARRHRPGLALLCGLFLPGAGQAYNGQPVLGALVLLTSVLVLPWLLGMAAAWSRAKRLAAEGGRVGRGGLLWVAFHVWLMLNVGLTAAIALSVAGVLT